MIEILKELGLNEYEAKTYEALVKFSKATAARISKESGVPYGRIYDILASLEQKGLVKTIPGQTNEFSPTNPDSLIKLFEKRKVDFEKGEKELQQLKKMYDTNITEPVLVASGVHNFHRLVKELGNPKSYAFSIRYQAEPRPEWIRQQKETISKGVDVKNLVRVAEDSVDNLRKWEKQLGKEHFRSMDNDGFVMSLRDDESILISLLNSNTAILIKDKAFCKFMKKAYIAVWDKSKEIDLARIKVKS